MEGTVEILMAYTCAPCRLVRRGDVGNHYCRYYNNIIIIIIIILIIIIVIIIGVYNTYARVKCIKTRLTRLRSTTAAAATTRSGLSACG